jgi:hypothetical protein
MSDARQSVADNVFHHQGVHLVIRELRLPACFIKISEARQCLSAPNVLIPARHSRSTFSGLTACSQTPLPNSDSYPTHVLELTA